MRCLPLLLAEEIGVRPLDRFEPRCGSHPANRCAAPALGLIMTTAHALGGTQRAGRRSLASIGDSSTARRVEVRARPGAAHGVDHGSQRELGLPFGHAVPDRDRRNSTRRHFRAVVAVNASGFEQLFASLALGLCLDVVISAAPGIPNDRVAQRLDLRSARYLAGWSCRALCRLRGRRARGGGSWAAGCARKARSEEGSHHRRQHSPCSPSAAAVK